MLKGRRVKSITALLMVVLMCICMLTSVFAGSTVYVERSADVAFIIDATGSMGGEIARVKEAIGDFLNLIAIEDVDVRVKFIVYKDTTNKEPTVCSKWYGIKDGASSYVSAIELGDGGDGPETIIDGYGMMLDSAFGFRSSAAKFSIAFTDADYKINNGYGYTTEKEVIDKLKSKGISNSMIVDKNQHESLYKPFCTNEGILEDINGDYAVSLKDIAKNVIEKVYSADDYIMSPRSGKEGDGTIVTISANPKKSDVTLSKAPVITFGGKRIENVEYAGGKASFKVPEDKIVGKYEVKMSLDGDSWSLGNFTVLSGAEYGDLSPKSATEGNSTLVTVPVKKMNYSSSFAVYLNGSKVTVNSKKTDCFTFTVPSTVKIGEHIVTVNNGDIPVEIGSFIVEPKVPVFGKISVKSIKEGTAVVEKVTVSNLGSYAGDFAVYMNGVKAEITYKGSSYFKFSVPKTFKSGEYRCEAVFNRTHYDLGTLTVEDIPVPDVKFGKINITSGGEGKSVTEKVTVSARPAYAKLTITIDGKECEIIYTGDSYLKFNTPTDLVSGTYDVIAVHGDDVVSLGSYTVGDEPFPIPVFSSISVPEGKIGANIVEKVSCTNVSKYPSDFTVLVNGVKCTIVYKGTSYFKFNLPDGLDVGVYDVIAIYDKKEYELGTYTIKSEPEPTVKYSELSVTTGKPGEVKLVKVSISEPIDYSSGFEVTLGGEAVEFTYKGSTYFKFNTPSGLDVGVYDVIASYKGFDKTIGTYTVEEEKIPDPVFGGLSVKSGKCGSTPNIKVTCSGISKYPSDFAVLVDGNEADLSYKGSTYFKFDIPAGLDIGVYEVKAVYGGKEFSLGNYEVLDEEDVEMFKATGFSKSKSGSTYIGKVNVSNIKYGNLKVYVGGVEVKLTYKGSTYFKFDLGSNKGPITVDYYKNKNVDLGYTF